MTRNGKPAGPSAAPECARDVIRAIGSRWNRGSVEYAVANGLEGYPLFTGRDIDVVVSRQHLRDAELIVGASLEEAGRVRVTRRRRELVQLIGLCPHGGDAIVIDLFPGLRWGPVWLVTAPAHTELTDVFAVDPWASFVKRILLHVLVAPGPKFRGAPDRLRLTDGERSAAAKRLSLLVGDGLAGRLLLAVEQQDVPALELLRPRLRRSLVTTALLRHPIPTVRGIGEWLRGRVSLAACPAAMPTVSVVGPDGVGKSTLIAEVARQARQRLRCSRVEVHHWRPGVLPQLGSLVGRPLPRGGTPPRRTPGRFAWVRALYYALDFVLGSVLRDRRVSRDLGLVLYDRGALDMCVDSLRYGLPSARPMSWLLRLMPRPDLVVLLRDDPARIRERKAELEEAEIHRQLELWAELAAAGQVDMVLEVDASPGELAGRVVDRIEKLFVARYRQD